MTYPNAIVAAAALLAVSIVWQAQAQNDPPGGPGITAIAGGELIWWLATTPKGTRIAVCDFDGRNINCQGEALPETLR